MTFEEWLAKRGGSWSRMTKDFAKEAWEAGLREGIKKEREAYSERANGDRR